MFEQRCLQSSKVKSARRRWRKSQKHCYEAPSQPPVQEARYCRNALSRQIVRVAWIYSFKQVSDKATSRSSGVSRLLPFPRTLPRDVTVGTPRKGYLSYGYRFADRNSDPTTVRGYHRPQAYTHHRSNDIPAFVSYLVSFLALDRLL
jgi:hypothetical protein